MVSVSLSVSIAIFFTTQGEADVNTAREPHGWLAIVTHGLGHTTASRTAQRRMSHYCASGRFRAGMNGQAAKESRTLPVTVLYYDWSGCGGSDGAGSEEDMYADIRAVVDFAEHTLGWHRRHIVVLGQSLGTGPTLELACSRDSQGLGGAILIHPFRSILAVRAPWSAALLFLRLVGADVFVADGRAEKCLLPTVVIHGDADATVPHDHGASIASELQRCGALLGPMLTVSGAGHGDMFDTHEFQVLNALADAWTRFDRRLPVTTQL